MKLIWDLNVNTGASLQASLDEVDMQTKKPLAEQLGVSQQTAFNQLWLREMRKMWERYGKDSEDR